MRVLASIFTTTFLIACGADMSGEPGDPSGSGDPSIGSSTGALRVFLTSDSPSRPPELSDLTQIIVQISEVRVHGPGGWMTISTGTTTVDVLRLSESAEELGVAELEAGEIGQIRLVIAEGSRSYVVDREGRTSPLKVPSGEQSGLKIRGQWDVGACAETTAVLSMDVADSIHLVRRGKDDLHILRPVLKAGASAQTPRDCPKEGDDDDDGALPDPDDDDEDDGEKDEDEDDGEDEMPRDYTPDGGDCVDSTECGTYSFCSEDGLCTPLGV